MAQPPPDPYLTPYREAHGVHGADFGVTLWANKRSQHLRFQVFTQMCFLHGKRILDAGCSRGDFAAYLNRQGIVYGRYVGVDGLAEVIEYARSRGLRDAEFHCGDFVARPKLLKTGRPQVIALSGALNTMDEPTAVAVLDAAWWAAGQSLIFNFLSDLAWKPAPPQDGPARCHNTLKLLEWALRQTSAVQFRNDYFKHGHDATILMRKV